MIKLINRIVLFFIYSIALLLAFAFTTFYIIKLPPSANAKAFARLIMLHRAKLNNLPENSMQTIQAACKQGIKAIEIDIVMTKDHRLILFHDHNMQQLLGLDTLVENTNYQTIKALNIIGSNAKVPLLTEVIPLIKQCHFKVQLDASTSYHPRIFAKKIAALFKHYQLYGQAYVSSVHPVPLYFIHKFDHRIITAFAVWPNYFHNVALNDFFHYVAKTWIPEGLGVGLVEPEIDLTSPHLVKFLQRHYYVNTWSLRQATTKKYVTDILHIGYITDCIGKETSCPIHPAPPKKYVFPV